MKFVNKLLIGTAVIIIAFIIWTFTLSSSPSKYDSFAQCISSKGMKMYGAFWCPHCQDQKKEFGTSVKYINYIECSTPDGNAQLPECTLAGIQSYPTWQLPSGKMQSGTLSFQELSALSECPLPN